MNRQEQRQRVNTYLKKLRKSKAECVVIDARQRFEARRAKYSEEKEMQYKAYMSRHTARLEAEAQKILERMENEENNSNC